PSTKAAIASSAERLSFLLSSATSSRHTAVTAECYGILPHGGDGNVAAAPEPGDFLRVDVVVLGPAAVDGLHVQGVPEHNGSLLLGPPCFFHKRARRCIPAFSLTPIPPGAYKRACLYFRFCSPSIISVREDSHAASGGSPATLGLHIDRALGRHRH